jgi:rhamnosyl/mannosyltransferase
MGKIKVLHIYKTYFPESLGGVEQFIRQLSMATKSHGVQSDVLALTNQPTRVHRYQGQILYSVYRNIELASMGVSVDSIYLLRKIIKRYDIIHCHYPWPYGDLLYLILGSKVPAILTYHSDIVRQKNLEKVYRPLQQRFLKKVSAIAVTSNNLLQTSVTLEKYRHKSSVIPIGLNMAHYPDLSVERQQHWKQKFGDNFFLFVGVLRYYKGLHILLEALKNTDITVVIAGTGPIENELKATANQLKLANVHFLGKINDTDKVALLCSCKAFVFPSCVRSEAFGISLLEAAMYGKPMISCEIGTGTTFINKADTTGLVIPPSNSEALIKAMQSLLSNPQRCEEMGRHARERYQTLFTEKSMSEKYYSLYLSAIADNKK